MKYSEFKEVCRSGDLIFVSHREWNTLSDIESQVVRIATESEFSHVCVAYLHNGEPCTIESVVPAVTVSSLEKYATQGFYWVSVADKPMTPLEEEYGLSQIGKPYSKLEAVEGYFDLIEIGGSENWFCAEITIAMRRLSGLDLGGHCTPSAVAKNALAKGYSLQFVERD
jgi:hypothetical protein